MIRRNGQLERRKNLQAFVKTRMCRYYPEGKCSLGQECKFAHEDTEIRAVPDFRKTRMCEAFKSGGCSLGDCPFAHDRSELKIITDVYKTALCRHWSTSPGFCKSGAACRFAHGSNELRDRAINTPLNDTSVFSAASTSLQEDSVDEDEIHSLLVQLLLLQQQQQQAA
jgi:hypothetical protein